MEKGHKKLVLVLKSVNPFCAGMFMFSIHYLK